MATEMRFPVEIDDSQAAKELNKLESKIGKLKDSIAKTESSRTPIVEQLKEAQDAAVKAYNRVEELKAALAESEYKTSPAGVTDPDTFYAELQKQAQIKAELAEQEKIMHAKEDEAQKLEKADAGILEKLKDQTAELEKAQTRAGELTKQITDASKGKDIKAAFAAASASLQSGTKNILKWGAGITGLVALARRLRAYIIEAVKSFAENDPETKANIDSLKASLAGLKASWGAAFAPVLNAVVPVLQTLISWLTAAANAIAQFFAVLSGKGTFKKAIANTGKLSSNLGGAADNAKEAKKQLMGIDTLTVMNDTNTGGSSGGGGGGSAGDGVDYKDVAVSENIKNNFELIKDIVLGIGAGIAGWGLGKVLSKLGLIKGGFKQLLGIAMLVSGAVIAIKGGIDAWENGVDWQNLIEMIGGVAFAAGGAALAFGKTGAAITLLIGGIGMIVTAFHDWITTGELSTQTATLFAGGIIAIGLALTLLTGSWIPLVIAAILALGVAIVKWWNEISAWLDSVVGKVNSFFNNAIKTLSEKGTLITGVFILLYGSVQTIFNAIAGVIKTVLATIRAVLITFAQVVRGFATGDWASSLEAIKSAWLDVWNSIAQTGANIINGIIGTVEAFVNNVIVMFNRLVSAVSSVMQFFGGSGISWRAGTVSIPRLAKGGIVDTATMFVAGEAGKEAIVPLERNTQWVTMVADGLIDRMTDKFAGLNMRMPAVAGGFVVPPNAFSSSGYGGISPELESKIDALLDRLNGNNRPIEVRTTVELDKRKVGESVYTYTEERNRGRGK